jgi:hypothetical protein
MSLFPTGLLALALAVLPPARPQGAAAGADGGWQNLDGAVVQAGDEVVLWSDVLRNYEVTRRRRNLSVSTAAERDRLLNRTLEDLVIMTLEAQAGEDREESPVDIEDRVDRFLENRRQSQGTVDYVEELEASGVSAQRERELQVSGYYTSAFRSQGLFGPRPTRDDFIRPGEIAELYRTQGEALGEGPSYRFQDLVVTADQVGGEAEARALAEELRERLVAGEDFQALHEEFGTTEVATDGVTRVFGPASPMPDPEIRRFAEDHDVGAISPVYPVFDRRQEGKVAGFRVLRLFERTPGAPPPAYEARGTQDLIREKASKNRDEIWLGVARERLRGSSYLWSSVTSGSGSPVASTPRSD